MEPLEFSYTATADDHARAIRAFTLRKPVTLFLSIGFGLLAVMTLCIFLGEIVLSLVTGNTQVTDITQLLNLLSSLLPCTAFYLVFPVYSLLIGPYLAGQQIKKYEDKIGQTTCVVDDDHVQVNSLQTKNEMKWTFFSKAMESKRYYFLVHAMNKRMFHFIPKRAFESPQQEADFRRYVEKNIGPIK
jgi:hypothetical protein